MNPSGGGIDPSTINPPDAVAALRSFPRRWRSALGLVADDPGAADLVRRRSGDSLSALEHAWHTADLLGSTEEWISRTRREDRPTLASAGRALGADTGDDDALEQALDAITSRAPALASTLESVGPDDWRRSATIEGRDVTILAMAQQAVVQAAHHLRAAEQSLKDARGGRRG